MITGNSAHNFVAFMNSNSVASEVLTVNYVLHGTVHGMSVGVVEDMLCTG